MKNNLVHHFFVSLLMIFSLLLVVACGNKGEQSTDAETAKETESAEAQSKMEDAASTTTEITLEEFSQDLGVLAGSETAQSVANVDINNFDKGFRRGFVQGQPEFSTDKLSEELNKYQSHVLKNKDKDATDDASSSIYNPSDMAAELSYGLGYIRANELAKLTNEIDLDIFLTSFSEAYSSSKSLDTEEIGSRVQQYIEKLQSKAAEQREQLVVANLEKSNKFLAENKKRAEVVTTESGLQYEVLVQGDGKKPQASDTVEVHYEGRLLDGTIFDSSYQRNQTATFPLSGVISGWTEGLQYMSIGSKYRLFIPPSLGYGIQGAGNDIEPNELLIFDVELISIK